MAWVKVVSIGLIGVVAQIIHARDGLRSDYRHGRPEIPHPGEEKTDLRPKLTSSNKSHHAYRHRDAAG